MARAAKVARRWSVYVLVRLLAFWISLLPFHVALALGKWGGRLIYRLAPRLRDLAVFQIREALRLDERSAEDIGRAAFENVGMVVAEIALLPRIHRCIQEYVELPDEDRRLLDEALSQKKGAIFVSAHLGNWELLAQRVAHEGFDCTSLARSLPNPYLGRWIVDLRRVGGVHTINRGDPRAAREMLGVLKRGGILGVLIDQDTRVPSVHVPFFGRPARTPLAAAELALRFDLPVILGFVRRNRGGPGLRIRLMRVVLEKDQAGAGQTGADDVLQGTAHLTRLIEEAIRAQPEEWVWFHHRWRTSASGTSVDEAPSA